MDFLGKAPDGRGGRGQDHTMLHAKYLPLSATPGERAVTYPCAHPSLPHLLEGAVG